MTEAIEKRDSLNYAEIVRLRCVEMLIEKLHGASFPPNKETINLVLRNAADMADYVLDGKVPR